MKRMLIVIGCLALGLGLGFGEASAQVTGKVNWQNGVLKTTDIGAPKEGVSGAQAWVLAEWAARVTALRDLAEYLHGIHISSETTVEDAVVKDDFIRARSGVIKQARQVGITRFDADGVATVEMAIAMEGDFADAVMPQTGFGMGFPTPAPSVPEAPALNLMPAPVPNGVTGLIIDARGLNLVSAMVPKVLDAEGRVVYGPELVDRATAVQNSGLAGYEKDLESAKQNDRVGEAPMVVKGMAGEGTYQANVVVSQADAERIREAVKGRTFLNQCRVVIVVD